MIVDHLADAEYLKSLPKDLLADIVQLHIRNLWRVDGLYFQGVERRFGVEAATDIDVECWETMGRIEARDLANTMKVDGKDVSSIIQLLRNTSWALYQTEKAFEAGPNHGIFKVLACRIQETRKRKGLEEFPCRNVRLGYLEGFAKELNPKVKVTCKTCPPNRHSTGIWCEWEFTST